LVVLGKQALQTLVLFILIAIYRYTASIFAITLLFGSVEFGEVM
jgi:hypothetical protein